MPIFKKGDKMLADSYRPISIVPIFSKIFESILLNQLNSYFTSNGLLSQSQFGFREGRSTTGAIMEVVNSTLEAFERKERVGLALCDLSKAFD